MLVKFLLLHLLIPTVQIFSNELSELIYKASKMISGSELDIDSYSNALRPLGKHIFAFPKWCKSLNVIHSWLKHQLVFSQLYPVVHKYKNKKNWQCRYVRQHIYSSTCSRCKIYLNQKWKSFMYLLKSDNYINSLDTGYFLGIRNWLG